jgi:sugar phosphate isomerase/epimerase
MKFSGRTQPLYPHYSILQALEKIKTLGFDGVEICLEIDEIAPDVLTNELVETIWAKVEQLNLKPHVVGYHKDYIYDDSEFQKTQTAIRLTPAFGTNILIFSGTSKRNGDSGEWKRMIQRTQTLVRIAEDHHVVLAQEFEPGFIVGSTQDLLNLFDEIPSPHLAANLDLGHVFLCDPDPLNSIRQLGPKIVHGHVENMAKGIHRHLLPQEGDINLQDYLSVLQTTGFTGSLALDLYDYDYAAQSMEALTYLRSISPKNT